MTAPTSLPETLAAALCGPATRHAPMPPCATCSRAGERAAEAARAWLVARLNEHGPKVVDGHVFRFANGEWGCRCGNTYTGSHAAHVVAALTEVLTDD